MKSNPGDGSTTEEETAHGEVPQAWWPALLVSSIAHIILVLILSLIVFGSGDKARWASQMLIAESEEFAFTEMPSFEVVPESAPEDIEQTVTSPDILKPLPLSAPPKLELPTKMEVRVGESSSEESSAADQIAVPVSKVAISIQKRVSDAGGRKGEVQFALAWKNVNDVDLHVIAPSGERISHLHKRSACRGMLDVDMNVKGESVEPVENVRWITNAPWGRYTVLVNLFRVHRAREPGGRVYRGSETQLLAQLGTESFLEKETVSKNKQLAVYRFRYVPANLPSLERERLLKELTQLQEQEESTAAPLLARAKDTPNQQLRDRLLNNIVMQFPHTDAAIEAMRLIGGSISKP